MVAPAQFVPRPGCAGHSGRVSGGGDEARPRRGTAVPPAAVPASGRRGWARVHDGPHTYSCPPLSGLRGRRGARERRVQSAPRRPSRTPRAPGCFHGPPGSWGPTNGGAGRECPPGRSLRRRSLVQPLIHAVCGCPHGLGLPAWKAPGVAGHHNGNRNRRKNAMPRKRIDRLPRKIRKQVQQLDKADQEKVETALRAGDAANRGDMETLEEIADSLPRNPDGTYKLD
jgi:hypothetical protein